jgi:cysteinyl-tRNA synthetase
LAQEAEGKTADAEKKLKKAQERERSLEAALNKEINLVKAMEALLTPQQKAQIKLSRQATS